MKNLLLKWRFLFFKSFCKKVDFSNRELVLEENFKSLDNFVIKDQDFYNDNPIWLSKDALSLTEEGLKITCKKVKATHTSYQGTRDTNWETGMIDTYGKFEHSKGLWVIEAKVGDGWPALWLLKRDRPIEGFTRQQITPEVDIMEIIHGMFRHTIHYGYSDIVYRRTSMGRSIKKWDNEFHEFAVDILNEGYNFYIDGILTAELRSKDPDFVTDAPSYIIINNAAHPYSTEDTEMIVRSMKVYK